jgi:phage shock protein C
LARNHLYRSVKDRKIAGVAGGIGEYLEIDPAIVRLVWLLAILFGGAGFLAYLIAWIVIPEAKVNTNEENNVQEKTVPSVGKTELTGGLTFLGVLLIVIGIYLLVKQFIPFGLVNYFWPIIIISLGIFLLIPKNK